MLAAAWPAWRAAGRPPVALLRGAELTRGSRGSTRFSARFPAVGAGLTGLGARLVGARRTRLIATVAALGFSTAFVLLLLALASALSSLETDPQALGKRYQLTADLPASAVAHVRSIPGVQAVAPRYEEEAVDSYSLGETIDVIAYPGNHTVFEAPPLVSGKRLRGRGQAEVGLGLAQALGLSPGSTLAIQLASGTELRLRVAGVVSSLDHDGRVAYVPAAALLAADPSAASDEQLAVVLRPGANAGAVSAALGSTAAAATGAVGRGVPLVAVLRSILRAIAIVDGLVCLYALIQACALTVQERRRTVSVLRAFGAGGAAVRRLLAGAVIALVVPAAVIGILLERLVLGPALSRLAASYVTLSLGASALEIVAVLAGLALAGGIAVAWVARPDHARERDRGDGRTVSLTRREAIMLGGAALLAAGCGSARSTSAGSGSTLASTWTDPRGTGTLSPGPGETFVARTELGRVRAADGVIATLAHVTDAHVLDASSPARVPFLDRLGAPFESTFRPQETLTAQVLAGATRAIRALGPDAVIQGGDLIDNDQRNELNWALAALRGGFVRPDRYYGVQLASDPDPFYYRPDLDAPQHPGLLARAARPFVSVGVGAPVHPVLGDHDILVAGEVEPTDETRALAVGNQALWELPTGLTVPPGTSLTAGGSPDGPPLPGLVNQFLARALAGPKVRVPANAGRVEMDPARGDRAPGPPRLVPRLPRGHRPRASPDRARPRPAWRRIGRTGSPRPAWLAGQPARELWRSMGDRRLTPAARELRRR